jgi:tRNA-2-methylthio-N6-dimethylallyladenosine synthase
VHFAAPIDEPPPRPGDFATVEVTYAAPHHLVADHPAHVVRRTRAGDAWEAQHERSAPQSAVLLGMPLKGQPARAAGAGI